MHSSNAQTAPKLWGGIECTVNRVDESYFDQLVYSGHHERMADLDSIGELGVSSLRYPVLWERAEQERERIDFSWSDPRLERLRELAIEPIVGLVHHGSGPPHTSLISGCFAEKLAAYAGFVAEQYPWVRTFTPVNEPLTTARFSGLYGHWYPHGQDDRTFVRALLTQCRAISLSMAAIRRITPDAILVQTEDMGFTRSTARLRYQADFENERRWLSLDLLSGKVWRDHPLFSYLLHSGATMIELESFVARPCPPDIVGLNYYITSERFLDSRTALYPEHMVGGNSRERYVDVEAVRVCADGIVGPVNILREAHQRYNAPIAITEAHLGCSASQQVSWFSYIWRSALEAQRQGVDVRAVTAWALLGAFGWDRLVTRGRGAYEPGAFDVSRGFVEKTELGQFLQSLSRGESADPEPGWWTLPSRLLYEPHRESARAA